MKTLKERIEDYENFDRDIRPEFPRNMLLEVTNACNHNCIFCANSKSTRRIKLLDENFAYRILKEAYDLGTREVGFYGTGEPLVNTKLENYIKYAKDIGYEYTYITTNAALLTYNRMKSIVESGIDSIKISFNAGTRESYNFIHGKDEFELVKKNIKNLVDYRKNIDGNFKIYMSCILTKYTKKEKKIIESEFENYIDEFTFFNCKNQCGVMYEINGNVAVEDDKKQEKNMCSLPFNKLHITSEGYLTACCADFQNYLVIADLNNTKLKDAWHNEEVISLRKKHIQGTLENTLCYNCLNNLNEEITPLIEELGEKIEKKDFDKTEDILNRIELLNNTKK